MRWKIAEWGDECAKFASSVHTYCLGEFFRFNFIDSSGLYIGKTGTSDAGRETGSKRARIRNYERETSPTAVLRLPLMALFEWFVATQYP